MTTRREHHLPSRLRHVEALSTATRTCGIRLCHHPNRAKRQTQPQGQGAFPAGSESKLEFEYDWERRSIKKVSHSAWNGSSYASVATTKFIHDGWNLLAELDSSNNVIRGHVWGTDLSGAMQGAGGVGGLPFVKESDGTPHFTAYDGNGTVMGLVKGKDGTSAATYEYDPFGQPLRATSTMSLANSMRFNTKFADNETGLLYYGYRNCSRSMGSWLNGNSIEDSTGPNHYAFVDNSSLIFIDFRGLQKWTDQPTIWTCQLQTRIQGRVNPVTGGSIQWAPPGLNALAATAPSPSGVFCRKRGRSRWIHHLILTGRLVNLRMPILSGILLSLRLSVPSTQR